MEINKNLEKLKDPKFYLENFTSIKGKKPGALVPFILNEAQKDLLNTVRTWNRVIILKARQIGFSTAMVGYFYHDTITNPGTTTALIGYNSDLTSELLDKVKVFYRTTPASLKPTIQYNSKYEISFPRINSKILVLPSTSNVGRGYTLTNCLATELSSWDDAEEKMITLEASVPINGKLVIESTPRGQGNLYHRMWMADDNDYAKNEYGWWWGYSREEIEIIRKRMNNPSKFAQEYGLEFLASGRAVFDPYMLRDQRSNTWRLDGEYDQNGVTYRVKEVDHLRIYKEPVADRNYVAGVDVSEGVDGGDYSVMHIFDRLTGEEVAMFRGLIPPDRLADKLYDWGVKYNKALMVVEINNHGLTTLTCLKQKIYPSLYFRPKKIDSLGLSSSDKFGWKTTKVTRPLLIDEFAQACRDGEVIIHSKELLDEMSVFIYDDNGNMVPQSGFHDDCLKKGTLIKTSEGYKEIEKIVPGDSVLTHKGRFCKVENCLKKSFNGNWYNFDISGRLDLELSYNHPLYVATGKYCNGSLINYSRRQWKLPSGILKSYKPISIIEELKNNKENVFVGKDNTQGKVNAKNIKIILNKEFAKFLGLFLAEGNCRKNSNQMSLAFHERDTDLLEEMKKYLQELGLFVSAFRIEKTHCRVLLFTSKTLYRLLKQCYDEKKEKQLPSFAKELGKDLKYVLEYWLIGDGWEDGRTHYDIIGATTSKKLGLEMRDIAWSSGFYAVIHKIKRHRYEVINKDQYYVSIKYTKNKDQHLKNLSSFEYAGKVKKIEKTNYNGTVYNLQVEKDNSFIADGIVVHNCIFAAGIAWQGFKLMPKTKLVQLDYQAHLPKSFAY